MRDYVLGMMAIRLRTPMPILEPARADTIVEGQVN